MAVLTELHRFTSELSRADAVAMRDQKAGNRSGTGSRACAAFGQVLEDGLDLRMPGLLAFSNSTAAFCAALGAAPTTHRW